MTYLDSVRVDAALREVLADLDYDLHKSLEYDETTGEDTYHECAHAFIRAYNRAG